MTAIFSFDETDEQLPRARRDTVSSISSFEDRWLHNMQTEDFDVHPRIRHFGSTWDNTVIAEEDETPIRVGTPPIPIPNGSHGKGDTHTHGYSGSVQVNFDEDFVAPQARDEGSLNKKMVPSDFEQVRVLGRGGYDLLCERC
jgi:hypothetical protein